MFDEAVHVKPYEKVHSIVRGDAYIVWRLGTGGNAELLHIRAGSKASGKDLLCLMLKAMDPPYATVFGFCLYDNENALQFYERMGFKLSRVDGVYDAGEAVVFSARYEDLRCRHA